MSGPWEVLADQRPIHVMPRGDLREHVADGIKCWCNPVRDIEEESVIVHNAMDRRELYEEGERKLS